MVSGAPRQFCRGVWKLVGFIVFAHASFGTPSSFVPRQNANRPHHVIPVGKNAKAALIVHMRQEIDFLEKQLLVLERSVATLLKSKEPGGETKYHNTEVKYFDEGLFGNQATKEMDASVIDSDQSWLDQSTLPTPPNEVNDAVFREGRILCEAHLSSVTPREMSPTSAIPLAKESISRISAIGRADLPFRLQRTMSMIDIVVPETFEQKNKPIEELVCFLDIDKCAIYGQDGNDLAIAMQWMQRPAEAVRGLYRRLINPQLRPLIRQLGMTVERMPVVLYTMRPQLIRYRSQVRSQRIQLRWKSSWHHTPDQVEIPSHVRSAEEILDEYEGGSPLYPQERRDLTMSFERLLAIRDAIQAELGLASPPPIVVSATVKDVQATAGKMGFSPAISYLWDDNQVLSGQPHVLTVDPFVALSKSQKNQVLDYLREQMPVESLSEEVVDFMVGAQPDIRSLVVERDGTRRYSLQETETESARFPMPDLPLTYPTPHFAYPSPCFEPSCHKRRSPTEGGAGCYWGSLAEYYSMSWRKSEEFEARRRWKEAIEMVW